MRRMLDPKEIGGGDINLYRHCVRLIGKGINPIDIISFNLYSTNSAKMEWEDLPTYLKGRVACSGYVYDRAMSKYHFANSINIKYGPVYISSVNDDWSEKIIEISASNYQVVDDVAKVS